MSTTIQADLILVHAPSVFDFRERDDLIFGALADSLSVNITPVFEMYPVGFLSLASYLKARGLRVEIVNLASLMLRFPDLDAGRLLERLDAPVIGFDLHWMIHCQGSLAAAAELKRRRPETFVIFGGISATYYRDELIRYPQVDVVIAGYDTLEPTCKLVSAICESRRDELKNIPNLSFKDRSGDINETPFNYLPEKLNDTDVDWSYYLPTGINLLNLPTLMILPNSGCAHDCGWCGGSRFAYRNIMGLDKKTVIFRGQRALDREVESINRLPAPVNIYSLQAYSEPTSRLVEYLQAVGDSGRVGSVALEQFHLAKRASLRRMVHAAGRAGLYINLSPESSDADVSRLSGRGVYSMRQMEDWIEMALGEGVKGVYVWFFIGMPRQTPESVMRTVAYSRRLMDRFAHETRVVPTLTPMAPFLDPGSRFFEEPEKHGYRVFFRGLSEHVAALEEPRWNYRLNYETRWLSRKQFLPLVYDALGSMTRHKMETGRLSPADGAAALDRLERSRALTEEYDAVLREDRRAPAGLRKAIVDWNRKVLTYSTDAIVQVDRPLGNRWFDDYAISPEMIADCSRQGAAT